MFNKNRKKSQMEIMGLAIIFVLVILGVLFAIRFVLTKPETSLRAGYIESRLAYNMVNAIRGASTQCHDATIERLLQDCAVSMMIECPGGMTSCDYVQEELDVILSSTLDAWGKDYEFSVTGLPRVEGIGYANTQCTGELEAEIQPIATRSGTIVMRLALC